MDYPNVHHMMCL